MTNEPDAPFLTIDETAHLLRIKRRTLDNLRWKGEGPPFRRHGGRILYHRDEVLEWSRQRRAARPRPGGDKDAPARGDADRRSGSARDRLPASKRPIAPLEHHS
jgi:predicted DNA-binding transcriptional regulator AlpA